MKLYCGYGLFEKEGRIIKEGHCCIWKNNSHSWKFMCIGRKSIGFSSQRMFDAFVQKAGCPQPHCSIRRRLDNIVHILVLLPMNTTKIDVYEYVNSKVQRIWNRRGISRTRL
jgi:hypothetical protein